MGTSARFFLGSLALAAIAIGLQHLQLQNLDRKLAASVEQCKRESEALRLRDPNAKSLGFSLVCEPEKLWSPGSLDKDPPGSQGDVVRAYRNRSYASSDWGYAVAAFLVTVGALPAIWYFLLRRLRELAAAVRGD